jgi:putative FmdB family regulatory protein
MPIFEYQCRECGTKFERIVQSGRNVTSCKQCGSKRVDQLLSVFAVGGTTGSSAAVEPGPCGACGAARRGMCGE